TTISVPGSVVDSVSDSGSAAAADSVSGSPSADAGAAVAGPDDGGSAAETRTSSVAVSRGMAEPDPDRCTTPRAISTSTAMPTSAYGDVADTAIRRPH